MAGDGLVRQVRAIVDRLHELGISVVPEADCDTIEALCEEFEKVDEALADLRDERQPDDEMADVFEHASRGFLSNDELWAGDGSRLRGLLRVGGTPLTIGDLLNAIPGVKA